MIVAGINALVRRSAWTPVRALTTTAKLGDSGNKSHNKGSNNRKTGNKARSAPEAGTKPPQKPKALPVAKASPAPNPKHKPAPAVVPTPKPSPSPTALLETSDATETRSYVPLPTPNPPLSAYALPPSKLRALIDLYHSSTNYITPETISDAIDETFAPRRYVPNTITRYQSYRDLIAQREELDTEPDRVVPTANELGGRGFGTADSIGGELIGGSWSASKGERARMVKAALWGVDPMAKIGLETLLEAKVELDTQEKGQEKE